MSKRKTAEENKSIILKTAVKLFAKNGFDATSVDEISEKSGINKGLIYSYFRSKEKILETIYQDVFGRLGKMIQQEVKSMKKPAAWSFDLHKDAHKKLFKYLLQESDAMKLIWREFTRDRKSVLIPMFFKYFGNLLQSGLETYSEIFNGKKMKNKDMFSFSVFFMETIPMLAFIVIGDRWCKNFNVSNEKAEKMFLQILEDAHYKGFLELHG